MPIEIFPEKMYTNIIILCLLIVKHKEREVKNMKLMYTSKEAYEKVKRFLVENEYRFEVEEENNLYILTVKEWR